MAGAGGHTRRWRLHAGLLVVLALGAGVAVLVADRSARAGGDGSTTSSEGSVTTSTSAAPATAPTTVAPTTTTSRPRLAPALGAVAGVTAFMATRPGNVTAAVYDFRTGQLSLYRPGVAEITASIVKVDILATLLSQAKARGRGLTTSELDRADDMIDESDNDAASDLWDEVGGSAGLAAFNAAIGLTGTVPNAPGYWGRTTTTAADQVALLRALVSPTPALDAASRAEALELMADVEPSQRWGVATGVPAGVGVALKNGWLPEPTGWQVNGLGIVDGGGRHYAMAVLTSDNRSENDGIATIEGLSRLVWQALAP